MVKLVARSRKNMSCGPVTSSVPMKQPGSKRRINSRDKGCRGERELAEFLIARGHSARRGQQNRGGEDSPDVVTNLPGLHIEVKRTETLSLYPAMAQAIKDAGPRLIPTVWHRRNHKEWLVILRADDFIKLIPIWVAQ